MAYRGRGRGRGFGGGFGFRADKQEPFIHFPEDVALPDRNGVTLNEDFVKWNYKLQTYFESSAYFVEESASQGGQSDDIERYSDWNKPRNKTKRESLTDYMKLEPGYFPLELVQGVRSRTRKKVKWNTNQDGKRLDLFEKLENKFKDGDTKDKDDNENNEDGDEEDGEEEEQEYSDDGDYEQNKDFDDDEDDFNDNDDGDDEPFY